MKCKLCGKDKKLVKAHIIPEALYKPLLDRGRPLKILSNIPGVHPKKSHVGIYDMGILCRECETIFSPWDDYAQKLLLAKPIPENYRTQNGQKLAYEIAGVDYAKLKLFFISVLWRASVSRQQFFSRVSVGTFEPQLKQMILESNPGDADTFAVTLAQFDHPLGTAMLDPHPDKHFGISYYRFYMAGYIAYIKADARPAPDFMGLLKLRPDKPLTILLRDLEGSKDFQVMQDIVKSPRHGSDLTSH
jgi:hypothetical protein